MTMNERPQWCQARLIAYDMQEKTVADVIKLAASTTAPSIPTISVRCLLGRGHTGPHQTSVRDEKVMFR